MGSRGLVRAVLSDTTLLVTKITYNVSTTIVRKICSIHVVTTKRKSTNLHTQYEGQFGSLSRTNSKLINHCFTFRVTTTQSLDLR